MKKKTPLREMIKSIDMSGNWTVLYLFVLVLFSIFSSNYVTITYDSRGADAPDRYCSDEGIEYFINGYTKTTSNNTFVLQVVYDSEQKPKKCKKKVY